MRVSRWLMTGLSVFAIVAVSGCTEGDAIQLAEIEALERRVDKQLRLVREQNEQINSNLKIIKAEMDTIKTFYIPAVMVALDSVRVKPEQARVQIIAEVDNRLRTIAESNREFRNSVKENTDASTKQLQDETRKKLDDYNTRITKSEEFVGFVLARQDSVNQEFAVRIDKRPWYRSILGMWDDQQRTRQSTP
ncbi:MAG: hypothetical protein SGI90_11160 [Candidatus Eisenbacteria bacterium]|nr:hypothetical protein [Candidatus Eisenbacteria bacterium]